MENIRYLKMVSWVPPYLDGLSDADWCALLAGDQALDARCTEFLDVYGLAVESRTTRHGDVEDMVSLPALCDAIGHGPAVWDGCEVRSPQEAHTSPWGAPVCDVRYMIRRHIPSYVNHQWMNRCDPAKTRAQQLCERELVRASSDYDKLLNGVAGRNPLNEEAERLLLAGDVRYEYNRAIDTFYGTPSRSIEGEQRMRNRLHAAWDIGGVSCVIATMNDAGLVVSALMEGYAIGQPEWDPNSQEEEIDEIGTNGLWSERTADALGI